MKKLLLLLSVTVHLYAKVLYSFTNVSINYLDWTAKTQTQTAQKDFEYVGAEGGIGWDWGDFYGFINIENPTKSYHDDSNSLRYVAFGDFDINIKNDFKIHLQNFHSHSNSFYVNDFVVGLSYKYENDSGFWIKPFIGSHFTNDTYYSGFNGYMSGWVFNYNFNIHKEKFSLSQWNEIEFQRNKSFYTDGSGISTGDGKSYGLNGAVSLWWNTNKSFSNGLQYRYANHKLGNIEYQSAYIYSIKYIF